MLRRAIAAARTVGGVLRSGPGAGALVLVAIFVVDTIAGHIGFLGHDGREAMALIMERAGGHALAQELRILGAMVVAGAVFGGVGALCGRAVDWSRAPGRHGAVLCAASRARWSATASSWRTASSSTPSSTRPVSTVQAGPPLEE